MKGFKFKLEALLKIRRLNEEECKQRIGRTQVEITRLKKIISQNDIDVAEVYEAQENLLSGGVSGQQVKFFPLFLEGKKAHNDKVFSQIRDMEEKLQEQFKELNELRASVKVLEKLEEKDKEAFKKQRDKKMYENIEEQIIIQNKYGKSE